jgi:ribosome recycling factor
MPTYGEAQAQMDRSIEALRREFNSVRTGKASPALLDMVRVDAYGSKMPLNQVASVSTPEPRMLIVQPWDKGLMGDIEKAIRNSELGLNPSNDGNVIRVPVPALNEERRREMVRMLHKIAEEGRIAVRHARQEANKEIKRLQGEHEISEDDAHREMVRMLHKIAEEGRIAVRHARQEANKEIKRLQGEHEISEDDAHREMDRIQKLTDEHIARIETLLKAKEEEVMEV